MLVISDASPLIALADIGRLSLLQSMFGEVVITDVVRREVQADLPEWITVENVYDFDTYEALKQQLDPGEASAIALSMETPNCLLIMDERKGRSVAKELGVEVIGLLGIILKAKQIGLIESGEIVLGELEEHGLWLSSKLKTELLKNLGE